MNDSRSPAVTCAEAVIADCLQASHHDHISLIFDDFGLPLAQAFSAAAMTTSTVICCRYVGYEEQRRSADIDALMGSLRHCVACSSILLFCGNGADECTRFRVNILRTAVANRSKIIHMPGVTLSEFVTAVDRLDFASLDAQGRTLTAKLDRGAVVEILTTNGNPEPMRLTLSIKNRPSHLCGGLARPGEIMNIPTGEVYIAPIETSASGTIVINGSGPNCVFSASDQVQLVFSGGVLDIERSTFPHSANSRRLLEDVIRPAAAKGVSNITLGELGIGLNHAITELTGDVICCEKAGGTAHIALGANVVFGGELDCHYHHDLIFRPLSILVDGQPLPGFSLSPGETPSCPDA